MKYEILEMESFSGRQAKIYSILPIGEEETLFEKFVHEYESGFREEIKDILKRIYQIGHTTGAREGFFKHHEGTPGDAVCALYDMPEKNLRLYCIRFGMDVLILGGGGEKAENIRAWQDDEKLSKEAKLIIDCAKDIGQSMKDGDLYWSKDGRELQGNFKNYDNE